MDHLSPPGLTRSPTSPPIELSYPSPPVIVEQQYRINPSYSSVPVCSVTPVYNPDLSLPHRRPMTQSEWTMSSIHHQTTTTITVPSVLSADYDPFATSYDAISTTYSQELYPTAVAQNSVSIHPSPSPVPSPVPLGASVKMEGSEYSESDISRYPSPPRTNPTSFTTGHSHHTLVSSELPQVATSAGYLAESHGSWTPASTKSEYPTQSLYNHLPTSTHDSPAHSSRVQPSGIHPGTSLPATTVLMQPRKLTKTAMRSGRKHPRKMTTREEANFECDVCHKFFGRSYNYKAHLETHDAQRVYPFPCTVKNCNKRFVRKTDLQRHNASVHLKEKSHKCEYCGRHFARKDTLRRFVQHSIYQEGSIR